MNDCTCTIVDSLDIDKDIEDRACPMHGVGDWALWDCSADECFVHTLIRAGSPIHCPSDDGDPPVLMATFKDVTWVEAKRLMDRHLHPTKNDQ